jgi:hypothetical protein
MIFPAKEKNDCLRNPKASAPLKSSRGDRLFDRDDFEAAQQQYQ